MSVKIRVSYTDEEELAGIIQMLSPLGEKVESGQEAEGAV